LIKEVIEVKKVIISTEEAPSAIGPYSQAVKAGHFLFVSGQLPINPEPGDLVGGSIKEKTGMVIENIKVILEKAGADLDSVVKTTIYLTDMSDFSAVNSIYTRYFGNSLPARSTMQVAALPKGAEIEMEVVALVR